MSNFLFLFEALFTKGPKLVLNPKSVNIGLYDTFTSIWHGITIYMYQICTMMKKNKDTRGLVVVKYLQIYGNNFVSVFWAIS